MPKRRIRQSKKEMRKEKSDQIEKNEKEGRSDRKDIEKDKREVCKERTEEKHQEMTAEGNVPREEQDGDNSNVSVDQQGTSAKPEDSAQDQHIDQTSYSRDTFCA